MRKVVQFVETTNQDSLPEPKVKGQIGVPEGQPEAKTKNQEGQPDELKNKVSEPNLEKAKRSLYFKP